MYIDLNNSGSNYRDLYKLAITFVTPRPIALVSSLSAEGVGNLAPFSFFNMVSAKPPVLVICPARQRDGAKKDTLRNIESTGEFVVATVTESISRSMHQASAPYPSEVDEFEATGFTPVAANKVKPSLVSESPVNCECLLERIIDYGDEPGAGSVIFGRIVAVHVDDAYLADDGLLDPDKLQTIGRMGRETYAMTRDRFDLPRAVVE